MTDCWSQEYATLGMGRKERVLFEAYLKKHSDNARNGHVIFECIFVEDNESHVVVKRYDGQLIKLPKSEVHIHPIKGRPNNYFLSVPGWLVVSQSLTQEN